MTENEAIKVLKDEHSYGYELNKACLIAIKALEEIQQYRAIGTVKGYERAIESSIENYNLYREYKAKVQDFEAIGTVEEFKALKEKNEPKKPYLYQKGLLDVKMLHCSVCNKEVISDWNKDLLNNYCHNCGQKLDWEGGATDEG